MNTKPDDDRLLRLFYKTGCRSKNDFKIMEATMSNKRLFFSPLGLILFLLFFSACNPLQANPTPVPPTVTPIPPTETPVIPTETPGPGISFSKDEALEIPDMSSAVGKGFSSFKEGELGVFLVETIGEVPAVNGKVCLWCFESIKIAPDLSIPIDLFRNMDQKELGTFKTATAGTISVSWELETVGGVRVIKEPKVIESITLSVVFSVPYDTEATEYILSGPDGATLEKVGNRFLLTDGVAYLVQNASP
jgi:hypothetical protein